MLFRRFIRATIIFRNRIPQSRPLKNLKSGQNENRIKVSNRNGKSSRKKNERIESIGGPHLPQQLTFIWIRLVTILYNRKHLVSQFPYRTVHNRRSPPPGQPFPYSFLFILRERAREKIKEHNTYLYLCMPHTRLQHRNKIWYKKSHGHWFAQIYQLVSLFCLPLQQKLKTTHKINK